MFLDEYIQRWGIRIFYGSFLFFMIFRLCFSGGTFLDRTVSYVSYPFLQAHSRVCGSIDFIKKRFQSLREAKEELQELYKKSEGLEARVIELEQAALFHERTTELVSFSHRYKESFHLLAKVLMRKRSSKEQVLFLDVGSHQGVESNMIVVYKNSLVGRIIRVYPLYSEVAFVTDKRCKVTAEMYETKVEGICEGQNEQQALLKFVPHFNKVSVGERLYSSGTGLLYPQGFLLGTVLFVKQGAVDQEISIQPAIDFDSLQYLYVIKS